MNHPCKRFKKKVKSVKTNADKVKQEFRGRKEHFWLGPSGRTIREIL